MDCETSFDVQGPVATTTFNRPEKRNALTIHVFTELIDALDRVEQDDAIRMNVLAGAGPAFCVGRELGVDAVRALYQVRRSPSWRLDRSPQDARRLDAAPRTQVPRRIST